MSKAFDMWPLFQKAAPLLLSVALLAGCGGGARHLLVDEFAPRHIRPVHYGISLPYPVSEKILSYDTAAPVLFSARQIQLRLDIDSKGRLVDWSPENRGDSLSASRYRTYFENLIFEPGRVNDTATAMKLLVRLSHDSNGGAPRIVYPVKPDRSVGRADYYWQALGELGVEVPALVSFPSYDFVSESPDRWRRYPYMIFKVWLDISGRVSHVEFVSGSSERYQKQLRSAIRWGKYRPLKIDGQAVASEAYLVLSLYSSVEYPTQPLAHEAADNFSVWDRTRVQLVADTAGLLAGPIPKKDWSGKLTGQNHLGVPDHLVTGMLTVDSLGESHVLDIETDFWRAKNVLITRARDIRFFPAIDYSGQAHSFEGWLQMSYLDETNVRIWFDWLGGTDWQPIIQSPATQ